MTDEEKNAAAAYIKLHEDVRQLVLTIVTKELTERPYDSFASLLGSHIARMITEQGLIRNELHNYRIVYKGTTAPTY